MTFMELFAFDYRFMIANPVLAFSFNLFFVYFVEWQFSWAFVKVAHACLEQSCRLSFLTWTFIIRALIQVLILY